VIEGFPHSAIVVVNLINPKEKLWGVLRSISAAGVTVQAINLDSFEDWARQLARGEEHNLDVTVQFVPLFRVERIFLDEPVGDLGSYSELFTRIVGVSPEEFLGINKSTPVRPV
jgi:hypothetical protein